MIDTVKMIIFLEGIYSDNVCKYLRTLKATTPAVAIIKSKLLEKIERRLDFVLNALPSSFFYIQYFQCDTVE